MKKTHFSCKVGRYLLKYVNYRNALVLYKKIPVGHKDNLFPVPLYIIIFKIKL